jgi:hypothetical protein
MKRVLISFLFLFLCGHAPTLIAQMPTLLPGQYEIEFSMPGDPRVRKDVHCYTAQELEALPKLLAGGGDDGNGCKMTTKVTGPTMTFTTVCAVAGSTVTTSGEMTFTSRESYRVVMKDPGHPTITGKRIGACPK